MLILTRKVGEVIRIGDDVTVRVLEVRGGQVRLGIDAPTEIRIFREEVYRAIQDGHDAPHAGPHEPDAGPANGASRGKPPGA